MMKCHHWMILALPFLALCSYVSGNLVPMEDRQMLLNPNFQRNEVQPFINPEDIDRPSFRLIRLILTENCRRWRDQGVSPLPMYCYQLGVGALGRSGSRPAATTDERQLSGFYEDYARGRPTDEITQDLREAGRSASSPSFSRRAVRGRHDIA